MSDLSILAAAREEPDRIALVDAQGALTFAQLAQMASAREGTKTRTLITPGRTRQHVAHLLGMLERREPFVLAHPRWTEAERSDAIRRTGAGERLGAEQALVFTSGSSGRAKIVRLSHDALLAAARAHARALPWLDDDRWLACLPLAHVGGLSILTRALFARRAVVLAPDETATEALATLIEQHRVTLVSLVPTQLGRLVAHPAPASLRAVLLGGAAAAPSLVVRARGAGWPVLPTYGSSETCAQVCTQRLGHERETGVGPPLPGVEVRIEDGRIEVRGPTLMEGYLDSAAPIVGGWYRTGDLGYLDEHGHLTVRGRADSTLITGGENVDPSEVEAALLTHPDIDEALVLGLPDAQWGQRIVAVIAGPTRLELASVEAHLEGPLARFKHPRELAWLPQLPRLPSGKVDRLRALGAFEAPDGRVSRPH